MFQHNDFSQLQPEEDRCASHFRGLIRQVLAGFHRLMLPGVTLSPDKSLIRCLFHFFLQYQEALFKHKHEVFLLFKHIDRNIWRNEKMKNLKSHCLKMSTSQALVSQGSRVIFCFWMHQGRLEAQARSSFWYISTKTVKHHPITWTSYSITFETIFKLQHKWPFGVD